MKKIFLLIGMVFLTLSLFAQEGYKCIMQTVIHNNVLYLYVDSQKYEKLSEDNKKELIKSELDVESLNTACVINHRNVEMWQKSYTTVKIIDSWNKDDVDYVVQTNNKTNSGNRLRTLDHPWFFNISGSLSFAEYTTTFHFGVYGRLGFFLLKGRWDLAVNCVLNGSKEAMNHGYIDETGHYVLPELKQTFDGSVGVNTRIYFPIKPIRTSPFVGAGVARSFGDGESATTIPVSCGVSISLKKGNIEFCYQYEKITKGTFVVGYTIMLR